MTEPGSSRGTPDLPAPTVREAVFGVLRAFGIDTIFGNPGSTELPMFRDFPADFRYVLGLQESIVVAMADGYAAASARPALVNLHSAIGVGHAMGSLFTAYRNQTPLVVTAGQQARSMLPFEPFLFSEQSTQLPKPYVKWSCEPARAEDVPLAIARAFHIAMQPPRGPAFVSVPVDDWDRHCAAPPVREVSGAVHGDPALLARAAAALDRARCPVIVVGAGVARDGAWQETVALAERHRARVWVSPLSSRNSFPEDHALFAGFLPAHRAGIVAALEGADLILVLGAPVFTYHREGSGPHIPEGAVLVQLVDDPGMASGAAVGLAIVTSLKTGVRALLDAAAPPPRPAPAALVRAAAEPGPEPGDRLGIAYLLQRIAAARPAGSIVVEEAPSSRTPMHRHLPMLEPDTFFTCASGGLGYALPAAVGVALARRDRRVIALLGDGSALYSIQGLWSAAELGLPITFIIINNGGYQALNEFGRLFGLSRLPGLAIGHLDFCAIARAQGLAAQRVERAAELEAALATAFSSSVPRLLEVLVSPD